MNIFCSGIGGIGLSAYACHRKKQGHHVSGSDKNDSPLIADLRSQGIEVSLMQDGSALPDSLDLLVYSEAIPDTAPERLKAAQRGIRQISYFKALGEMTQNTKLIGVCGTHGKSSTTAMAARVLIELGADPSVVVGTKLKELDGRNWRRGAGEWWVVEACEYRRSFHFLSPEIILVTNADGDHFDAYKDIEDYQAAFIEFFKRLPKDGVIIAHGADDQVTRLARASGKRMIDADEQPLIALKTPGLHMQQNARLVLALADHLTLDAGKAAAALGSYAGSWRRLETKGAMPNGALVIDDYGHHPVEIKATLSAMRTGYPGKRILCVFQPHTHDRTLNLWDDFAHSFSRADIIFVTDIYDARPDIDQQKADVGQLAQAIRDAGGKEVIVTPALADAERAVRAAAGKDDVVITMGAGNITKLSDALVSR